MIANIFNKKIFLGSLLKEFLSDFWTRDINSNTYDQIDSSSVTNPRISFILLNIKCFFNNIFSTYNIRSNKTFTKIFKYFK